jgi:hypothetical protein
MNTSNVGFIFGIGACRANGRQLSRFSPANDRDMARFHVLSIPNPGTNRDGISTSINLRTGTNAQGRQTAPAQQNQNRTRIDAPPPPAPDSTAPDSTQE